MAASEDNERPEDAVAPHGSKSEHIASRDFATETRDYPSEHGSASEGGSHRRYSEEISRGRVSRDFDDIAPENSLPPVAPQDPSVPDIVPSAAAASLGATAVTAPSAANPRRWLMVEGIEGVWQYEPGIQRPKFIEKKIAPNLTDTNEATLLKAARLGHERVVADILRENSADTECVEKLRGRTPLLCAAESSNAEIVQLLLDRGARWQATDTAKRTALHLASLNGRDEIVQMLLQQTEIGVDDTDNQGELFSCPRSKYYQELSYIPKLNPSMVKGYYTDKLDQKARHCILPLIVETRLQYSIS